jgi:hypothetical protein
LKALNILSFSSSEASLKFSSESLKEYIYQNIIDKKKLHSFIAEILSANAELADPLEIAKRYEKAEDYEKAYMFYWKEIELSEKLSAFNNVKKILLHLKELKLNPDKKFLIDKKLCDIYKNIGDYSTVYSCLNKFHMIIRNWQMN